VEEQRAQFIESAESFISTAAQSKVVPLGLGASLATGEAPGEASGEAVEAVEPQAGLNRMKYMDLLVLICLRFMEAQAVESLGEAFAQENSAINTSSCEFLELLITHVEESKICLNLCNYIIELLLRI